MRRIKFGMKILWMRISHPFRRTFTANVCKHKTKITGICTSFGEIYTMTMPPAKNKVPDYCLDCIGKMAIRCAWCGKPILIGDPVTLYTPEEGAEIPKYAVRYSGDPRCLVGCLRFDCADTGADRSGFWVPPGLVKKVPSVIEMLMASQGPSKVLIINNLRDPNDHGTFV